MAGVVGYVGAKPEYSGARGHSVDHCARRLPVRDGKARVGCGQCGGRVRRYADAVEL